MKNYNYDKKEEFIKRLKRIDKKDYKFFAIVIIFCIIAICILITEFLNGLGVAVSDFSESLSNDEGFKSLNKTAKSFNEFKNENPNLFTESSFDNLEKIEGVGCFSKMKDDGTIVISVEDKEMDFRLIGVKSLDKEISPEEGNAISVINKKIEVGDYIFFEYDNDLEHESAYLYFVDGTMIQDWLLNNGYAELDRTNDKIKYFSSFSEKEATAKDKKKGIWNKS